jgi:hypothetical protein
MIAWWQLIYSQEDLTHRLQSFSKETPSVNRLRMLFLAICLANSCFAGYLLGVWALFAYATHITITLTNVYFGVAIYCSWRARQEKSQAPSFSALALHHILFEVMILANLVVVSLYWSLLHATELEYYSGKPLNIINLYWSHGMPGILAAANFWLTDVVVCASHVKLIIVLAIAYGWHNYSETKRTGRPLYNFLTWEDHTTVLIYSWIILAATGVFCGLAVLSQALKRGSKTEKRH